MTTGTLPERLRELLEKATPGEWKICLGGTKFVSVTNSSRQEIVAKVPLLADANLIVEGLSALPALLSRIEALESALGDCANSLEAELNARFPLETRKYPSIQADYDAEMSVVQAARRLVEGK